MDEVNFIKFTEGISSKGWSFKKEYPSVISNNSSKDLKEEIWITCERLNIPVGKKKVAIRFYLWIYDDDGRYICKVGMVPDKKSLDEKALEILKKSTKGKFMKNPYLYLLRDSDYSSVFLYEDEIKPRDIEEVKECMKISINKIEKNLLYYLQGGSTRTDNYIDDINDEGVKNRSEKKAKTGWAVLVRTRSGSI